MIFPSRTAYAARLVFLPPRIYEGGMSCDSMTGGSWASILLPQSACLADSPLLKAGAKGGIAADFPKRRM